VQIVVVVLLLGDIDPGRTYRNDHAVLLSVDEILADELAVDFVEHETELTR